MSSIELLTNKEYKYGFVTDIESDMIPRGLSEDTVRLISAKKDEPEWMLEFRLKTYRRWLKMSEPKHWPNITYPEVNYQDIIYYSAPKQKATKASLDEVDPELLRTFEKLGIPLNEQKQLANVAVDAVFDSVSVATTYKEKLKKHGVIFCSFTEAIKDHPELVRAHFRSAALRRHAKAQDTAAAGTARPNTLHTRHATAGVAAPAIGGNHYPWLSSA